MEEMNLNQFTSQLIPVNTYVTVHLIGSMGMEIDTYPLYRRTVLNDNDRRFTINYGKCKVLDICFQPEKRKYDVYIDMHSKGDDCIDLG